MVWTSTRLLKLLVALSAIAAAVSGAGAAGWWNAQWPYRRLVTVEEVKPTNLPGEEIITVTMPTGGLCLRDGSDIRVAASDGTQRPCRVLMMGPGDMAKVAFATRSRANRYYVYWGNSKPPGGAGKLDVRRGVFLEMWEYGGKGVRNLQSAEKALQNPGRLIGRGFRDRVFLGHNPFGPQSSVASIFTGYLVCPSDGKYIFACSSQNASFLLVNDKLVVDNGGWHRPQRDISKQGTVELNRGLHKLTFYHVSQGGNPVVVAAWAPPGQNRVTPIPPGAFAPVLRGKCEAMEQYSRTATIDFMPQHAGEAFMKNRYFQRYAFKALVTGRAGRKIPWQWDFGDGQISFDAEVEHVYLVSGQYKVTLTARTPAGELKRTNRIFVTRPWDRVTVSRLDGLRKHADIVARYDFKLLPAEAIARAAELLDRASYRQALLLAGEAFLERTEAPAEAARTVATLYTDALLADGRSNEATVALARGAKITNNPAVAAELLVRAGSIALNEKNDPKLAMEVFQSVIDKYAPLTTAPAIRQARIGVGDVRRAQGDYTGAFEAYRKAGIRAEDAKKRRPVLKGDFARHVEDFIRRGDLSAAADKLDEWEETLPLHKLEGYSTLLRVRLLKAQKKWARAANEAEVLVRVNPSSNYAAELLMLAADAYEANKQADKAAGALKRVVEKYPESPFAAEASERLPKAR